MNRYFHRFMLVAVVLALVAGYLLIPGGSVRVASAQGETLLFLPAIQSFGRATAARATTAPPLSNAFGKTLAEWQATYWEWWIPALNAAVTEGDLSADRGTQVDNVFLLPVYEVLEPFPKSVEVSPGTAFMLPVHMLLGFGYLDAAGNTVAWDVQAGLGDFVDTDTEVMITLDGDTLLCYPAGEDCQREADLAKYYTVGDFEPPYFVPLFGADVIWFEGLGLVLPPLPPGEHTLHLVVNNPITSDTVDENGEVIFTTTYSDPFDQTWTITVTPPGLAEND